MITRLVRLFVVFVSLLGTSFSTPIAEQLVDQVADAARGVMEFAVADFAGGDLCVAGEGDDQELSGRLVQEPLRRSLRPDFSASHIQRANQRTSIFMLRAFNEALGDNWKSTVLLIHGGEQVALGAVVDKDGWIVTKLSQLPPSGEITCRLFDGREAIASLVNRVPDQDLALMHIPETNLTAITWDVASAPQRGKWLATTDINATPVAVGVISAGLQKVSARDPRLGVSLEETRGGGAVAMVLPGSGAYDAGVRRGDTVFSVNGKMLNSRDEVLRAIKESGRAGDFIRLGIDRAERRFEVEARLMDLTDELLDPTEMEVNGRVSARSTGFSNVFLHDTVLEPQQCGGPLVNLDGKVVGINIARAGRVSSYALPAQTVKPIVDSLLAQAKLVSAPAASASSTLRPIR